MVFWIWLPIKQIFLISSNDVAECKNKSIIESVLFPDIYNTNDNLWKYFA